MAARKRMHRYGDPKALTKRKALELAIDASYALGTAQPARLIVALLECRNALRDHVAASLMAAGRRRRRRP